MNENERARSERLAGSMMKALAIIGLIAILALAAWLSVQVFRSVPTALNSVRSGFSSAAVTLTSVFKQKEEVALALTSEKPVVNIGTPNTFTINYTGRDTEATYTLNYECVNDVSFTITTEGGKEATTTCEVPFALTPTGNTFTVTPRSTKARYVDVRLTVARTAATGTPNVLRATSLITVVNEAIADALTATTTGVTSTTATPVTKTPASTPAPTKTTATPEPVVVRVPLHTGPADLAVTIESTGIIYTTDNTFVAVSPVPSDQRAAVKFVVENKGGTATGPWGFKARLPVVGNASYEFNSPLQASLEPGDRKEFTLGFDSVIKQATATVSIALVPGNTADNLTNNLAQKTIAITVK